jgi:hypothetical protein
MQIYKIDDVREFMAVLFLKENFDKFCVGTMEIKTLVSISVKGNLLTEWLTEEEKEVYGSREYVPWKLLRPLAFSLIKGEQTPQLLRIQFVHYMNNGDCGGLRIQYENNELHCISSYTPANFTLDKSSEQMWDDKCSEFFHKNRIVSTRL